MAAARDKQATFTGAQQRAGVYVLEFAVAGLFGRGRMRPPAKAKATKPRGYQTKGGRSRKGGSARSRAAPPRKPSGAPTEKAESGDRGALFDGLDDDDDEELSPGFKFDWGVYRAAFDNTPIEDAVTILFAEYALLYTRIAGWTTASKPEPMSLEEVRSIQDEATHIVLNFMSPILVYVHTSQVHKLLAHMMDSIRYHGSLSNGNTSANESAHKADKNLYRRTNMEIATFTEQRVRHAQGAGEVVRQHNAADAHAVLYHPLVPSKKKRSGLSGLETKANDESAADSNGASEAAPACTSGANVDRTERTGPTWTAPAGAAGARPVGGTAVHRAAAPGYTEASGAPAAVSTGSNESAVAGAAGANVAASAGEAGASEAAARSGTGASGAAAVGGTGANGTAAASATGRNETETVRAVGASEEAGGAATDASGAPTAGATGNNEAVAGAVRAIGVTAAADAMGANGAAAVCGNGAPPAGSFSAGGRRLAGALKRVTMRTLSQRSGLALVGDLFKLLPDDVVPVSSTVEIVLVFDCGYRRKQLIQAAHHLRTGKPWYDAIMYATDKKEVFGETTAGGSAEAVGVGPSAARADDCGEELRTGEVRALVWCKEDDIAVVCEFEPVPPVSGCPFDATECDRLAWAGSAARGSVIRGVPLRMVRRHVHVPPDFKDLAARKGFQAAPAGYNSPLADLHAMRHSVNDFNPWV